MNFESKSVNELESLIASIKSELDKRKVGKTMPVFVVDSGDTNSCFKVEAEALEWLSEKYTAFNEGCTTRCRIRDVPEADYELLSNDWIEV
jgi:hypothetical protein